LKILHILNWMLLGALLLSVIIIAGYAVGASLPDKPDFTVGVFTCDGRPAVLWVFSKDGVRRLDKENPVRDDALPTFLKWVNSAPHDFVTAPCAKDRL
jgi:hypothetical protein